MPRAFEINFDGLVGPTHNYAGLSWGNLASQAHRAHVSSPRSAALQGLAKMKRLAEMGVRQAVLPPQDRPNVAALRRLGFTGNRDEDVIAAAGRHAPHVLAACCSASSMWAANAATISPSGDTADGKVHFTPANLVGNLHRAIEPPVTGRVLRAIFNDPRRFAHHDPLPAAGNFGDEGAANHTRLSASDGHPGAGVEWFVFGRMMSSEKVNQLTRYPARQVSEASHAVARLHGLDPARTIFAQQHPTAIDAGVFHNDVIAVGNRDVLLLHEQALVEQQQVIEELRRAFAHATGGSPADLNVIEVSRDALPVEDAVATYLFNSQLVTLPDGSMALVCPVECERHDVARGVIDRIIESDKNPIAQAVFVDTRQSMSNGGGPACLRLRVVLTEDELAAMHRGVLFDDALHAKLVAWIEKHYRDRLTPHDLADPALLRESRAALDALMDILDLRGRFDPFD